MGLVSAPSPIMVKKTRRERFTCILRCFRTILHDQPPETIQTAVRTSAGLPSHDGTVLADRALSFELGPAFLVNMSNLCVTLGRTRPAGQRRGPFVVKARAATAGPIRRLGD